MPPKKSSVEAFTAQRELSHISEDEQLRILQSTGLLHRIPKGSSTGGKPLLSFDKDEIPDLLPGVTIHEVPLEDTKQDGQEEEEDEEVSVGEMIADAFIWVIPFCFLHIGLDLAVHAQYASHLTISSAAFDALKIFPPFLLLAYLTLPHPSYPTSFPVLFLVFALTSFSGLRLIWMVNYANYERVMKMCPLLGTLWVWGTVRLDLKACIASLAVVTTGVYWYDLRVLRWEQRGGPPSYYL